MARLDIKKDSLEELIEALRVISGGEDKMAKADFIFTLSSQGECMHSSEIEDILKDLGDSVMFDNNIYIEDFAKMIYNR